MTTQKECEWIMSGFGGQDLAGSDEENRELINESVQQFLNDKKNYTGRYIRYLKDIGHFGGEDEKLNIIHRINLLLDKQSEYKLLKIERVIKEMI